MAEQKTRATRAWVIPVAVVAVAALLIGFVLWQQNTNQQAATEHAPQTSPGPESGQPQQPDLTEIERRDPADVQAIGPVDAPVGLVVFSDYQCPYCAAWNHDTLPAMLDYVDAGQLRIEWRDINVFGTASERAARAAYAAGLQDGYWDYHHALFPDGEHLPESALTEDALITLAVDLGLDRNQFASDLNSPEVSQAVTETAREGMSLGVTSTPVFLLGGQPLVGAQPTEVFTQAMDAALEGAGR